MKRARPSVRWRAPCKSPGRVPDWREHRAHTTHCGPGQKWPVGTSGRLPQLTETPGNFAIGQEVQFASFNPPKCSASVARKRRPGTLQLPSRRAGGMSSCLPKPNGAIEKSWITFFREARLLGPTHRLGPRHPAITGRPTPITVLGTNYRTVIRGKARPFSKYRTPFPIRLLWRWWVTPSFPGAYHNHCCKALPALALHRPLA